MSFWGWYCVKIDKKRQLLVENGGMSMQIIYTLLAAIVCMALVVAVDIGITKIFKEKSILQKNYIKMPLSYFIGIFVFLLLAQLIFS